MTSATQIVRYDHCYFGIPDAYAFIWVRMGMRYDVLANGTFMKIFVCAENLEHEAEMINLSRESSEISQQCIYNSEMTETCISRTARSVNYVR